MVMRVLGEKTKGLSSRDIKTIVKGVEISQEKMRKEEGERSKAPTPVQARELFSSSEKPKITPLKSASTLEEQTTAEKSPTPNLIRPDLVLKDPVRVPETPMETIIESPDEEDEESDD